MAKYKVRVNQERGVEEVQFEPLKDAPRIPSLYQTDPVKFGEYEHGAEVEIDPDEHAARLQSVVAEREAERAAREAAEMKPTSEARAIEAKRPARVASERAPELILPKQPEPPAAA